MFVYKEGVVIGVGELEAGEVVEDHEEDAEAGTYADEKSEKKRDAQKREPPFIEEIYNGEDVGTCKPGIKTCERFSSAQESSGGPCWIQDFCDAGVEKHPAEGKA